MSIPFRCFQDFLNKKLIKTKNKLLDEVLGRYSFHYISLINEIEQNPQIIQNIKDSHVILINIYNDPTEESSKLHFILGIKNMILFIKQTSENILQFLLEAKDNPEICFLKNAKETFTSHINIKYKENEYTENFEEEYCNFNEEIYRIIKEKFPYRSIITIIKSCISGYLIKESYYYSTLDRISNFNSNENKSIKPREMNENELIFLRFIGAGRLSKADLYYNIKDKKLCIIKKLNTDEKEEESKLYNREINNYMNIKHPFIPQFYGQLKQDGNKKNYYPVIEFINGKTLFDTDLSTFSQNEILSIIFHLLSVIKYLHSNNYVYRDLKPDNIMIDHNKILVLIDFDRMIKINNNNNNGEILPSNLSSMFVAPEISNHDKFITNKSDIYSVGLLIQYILNHSNPDNQSMINNRFIKSILDICSKQNTEDRTDSPPLLLLLTVYIIEQNIFLYHIDTKEQINIAALYGNKEEYDIFILYLSYAADQNDSQAQYLLGSIFFLGQYVKQDINRGLHYFELAADQNNSDAQYSLGLAYYKGRLIEQDINKAIHYFSLAADQYNSKALYNLGIIYLDNKFVSQDINKAIGFISRAAEQKNSNAIALLGSFYSEGIYLEKDIEKATFYLSQAADHNNSLALFNLGLIHYKNINDPQDIDKAIHYFTLAADQNNSEAQYNLGIIYYDDKYVPRDIKKSIHYFTLAAKQNNSNAQYNLGTIYCNNKYVPRDNEKSIHYFKLAADQNNPEAQYSLGLAYYDGKFIKRDIKKAIYYLTLAADQNILEAQYNLGLIYYDGEFIKRDAKKAIYYLTLAADQNYIDAQFELGRIYLDKKYNQQDINKGIHYITLAADGNHLKAQILIGLMYYSGINVTSNINKSIYYLSLASNQNNSEAQYRLGYIYYENKYVPRNIKKSIEYFILAANQNDSRALEILGDIYYEGEFIPRNIKKAIEYYSLASNQNNSQAQVNLGIIYYDNKYIKRNIKKAIHYFTIASDNNISIAQYNLGIIYYDNKYVPRNINKAIFYFTLAADHNISQAQFNLGLIYYDNKYIPQDINKAIYYYTLAAKQNDSWAQYNLGSIYLKGKLVNQNIQNGINLMYQAAKNNSIKALFTLGFLYQQGKYLPKDINKALYYYKEASSFNDHYSKNNLGILYKHGFKDIIKKSYNAAEIYFDEAIKQNNDPVAMYNLAHIYIYDISTEKSINDSIDLLIKSSNLGFLNSTELLCLVLVKKYGTNLNEIKKEITKCNDIASKTMLLLIETLSGEKIEIPSIFYNLFNDRKEIDFLYDNFTNEIMSKEFFEEKIDPKQKEEKNRVVVTKSFYEGFGIDI